MRILSVGRMSGISNTCRLRNVALEKIAESVDVINTQETRIGFWYKVAYHLFLLGIPIRLPDVDKSNKKLLAKLRENEFDVVWIDKGVTINPETLKSVKIIQPNTKIVSYSPDNMALRHNQSQNYLECIPLYDYHITMKSYILEDMRKLGAKDIQFVSMSYENSFHYPREISEVDMSRLDADVGFVGSWEKERMESILYLTRNGVKVRVFGDEGWNVCRGDNENLIIETSGLHNEDYAKSFRCFKISLCFLRKINYDQQTSRTMEIPACGGFMLAERTREHLMLFEEGEEAEYFDSNEELLTKCKYYLEHNEERNIIANNGRQRCLNSGYSNLETMRRILDYILGNTNKLIDVVNCNGN